MSNASLVTIGNGAVEAAFPVSKNDELVVLATTAEPASMDAKSTRVNVMALRLICMITDPQSFDLLPMEIYPARIQYTGWVKPATKTDVPEVWGIYKHGQIAGYSQTFSGEAHAVLWTLTGEDIGSRRTCHQALFQLLS